MPAFILGLIMFSRFKYLLVIISILLFPGVNAYAEITECRIGLYLSQQLLNDDFIRKAGDLPWDEDDVKAVLEIPDFWLTINGGAIFKADEYERSWGGGQGTYLQLVYDPVKCGTHFYVSGSLQYLGRLEDGQTVKKLYAFLGYYNYNMSVGWNLLVNFNPFYIARIIPEAQTGSTGSRAK